MELKPIELTAIERHKAGRTYVSSPEELPRDLPREYVEFMREANGGLTKDMFFHFFGLSGPSRHNVLVWNEPGLWKHHFGLTSDSFVFVEDMLGGQYFFKRGPRRNAVYLLTVSNGQEYFMADTFTRFIEDVVDNREEVCSDAIALARQFLSCTDYEWGPFLHVSHKTPVFLGGSADRVSNLELCDSLTNLLITGQLLAQLKQLAPGTEIKDIQIDYEKLIVRVVV